MNQKITSCLCIKKKRRNKKKPRKVQDLAEQVEKKNTSFQKQLTRDADFIPF